MIAKVLIFCSMAKIAEANTAAKELADIKTAISESNASEADKKKAAAKIYKNFPLFSFRGNMPFVRFTINDDTGNVNVAETVKYYSKSLKNLDDEKKKLPDAINDLLEVGLNDKEVVKLVQNKVFWLKVYEVLFLALPALLFGGWKFMEMNKTKNAKKSKTNKKK